MDGMALSAAKKLAEFSKRDASRDGLKKKEQCQTKKNILSCK